MKTQSTSRRQRMCLAALLAGLVACVPALGQEPQRAPVMVGGGASLDHDLYTMRSSPDGSIAPRRPPSLLRLSVSPVFSFANGLTLPLNLALTIPETTILPRNSTASNLGDVLGNPANSLSMTPRFGWAQVSLGTQTPRLSKLSGGDIQLFGVGVDLTPGDFRIAAAAGAVGRGVEADTSTRTPGEFRRQAYMGRLAYVAGATEIGLNAVRIRDDGASIPTLMVRTIVRPDPANLAIADTFLLRDPLMPRPEESFTASVDARLPIADGILVDAEAGGSMFTRDMTSGSLAEPVGALRPLMAQRLSTRTDVAGRIAVGVERETWGVSLHSSYVGPGYRTLAYPWLPPDRLEVRADPHLSLLGGDLSLSGSIGWSRNNLGRTEEATTSGLLGSMRADMRIGDEIAIDAQFSNYGIRTPVRNDTLRVETVSRSMSLMPVVTLTSATVTHVITASASIDDYFDYNPIDGSGGGNHTHSLMGAYSASLAAIPLTIDLTGSWLANRMSAGDLTIVGGSIGAGYKLFGDAVTIAATGTLTRTTIASAASEEGITLRFNGAWRITGALRLRADLSITSYRYGALAPAASMRENLLRTSLQWSW